MFGECHAHVIMDGINYKAAVALHKDGVCEAAVRAHLKEWKDAGITFVRDGGDARGASKKAKNWRRSMGLITVLRCLPFINVIITVVLWDCPLIRGQSMRRWF